MFFRKKKNKEEELDFLPQRGLSEMEADLIAPPSLIERLPGEEQATDYWLEVGDNIGGANYIRSWFAKWTGRTTWVGMLDPILLSEGDANVDLTVSVDPVEANGIMMRLANRIAILQAELYTEQNPAKIGAMHQELADLEGQMARLRVNAEKLFKTSVVLTVGASTPEKMRRVSKTILKRMGAIGVKFQAVDTQQLEVWRHSIGIGTKPTSKDLYMSMESSNVADFFLYGYGGLTHRTGIILGFDSFNRPVFYDGWHPKLNNQHMVIFGRSGSGKSFTIKVIVRRSAILGTRTAIVDPQLEYKNLVLSMNGSYLELAPKPNGSSYHQINIYDVEEEEDEHGNFFVNLEEATKAVIAVLFKMIRTIDQNLLTGQVKVALYNTLQDLYAGREITTDPNSLYTLENGVWMKKVMPTLYDHYLLMQKHPELERIHPIIRMFTSVGGDPSKAIFDGHSTFTIGNESVFGISLDGLDEDLMKPIGIFVATKWIWERFGKKNRQQKKRIIVDEAQLLMEDPEEAKWLENSYRRGRHHNVSMCAVTQGFEVFLRVPEGMGILKNAPTKLLLRQESVDIEAVTGRFDLAEGEARFLLTSPAGVGILKVDDESTIVRIQSTPNEYALYTTDPNDLAMETV
jgi:conjugal transfer ATP-binding protein TraC